MFYTVLEDTTVGHLMIAGDDSGLKHIAFSETHFSAPGVEPQPDWERNDRKLREPVKQLAAYFAGKLRKFDLPLAAEGTEFQKSVWKALCQVPYGSTASYGDIARKIANPAACRAVGLANGRNPLAIVVPCHRIIGSQGRMVGYGGGLSRKETLLRLEGAIS